jgi:hypothetical protein
MARRQGPQLLSLICAKAFEADDLMRPEAADPHQGQGHERSRNRPDRFVLSKPSAPVDRLAREASIDWHRVPPRTSSSPSMPFNDIETA